MSILGRCPFGYTRRMITLTPSQRRELRARAHPLHPVVAIGHAGLSPAVLHEIDVALTAHELVKVRVHSDDRDEREAHLAGICESLEAAPVQHLGKLLILWRPVPKPAPEPRRREKPAKSPARRRETQGAPASLAKRRGPPVPSIGARSAQHRRGTARHAPLGSGPEETAPSPRRRQPAELAPPAGAPRRRVAGMPAAFRERRPATGKRPPSSSKRPPREGKLPSSGATYAPREGKRPSSGSKRPPREAKLPSSGAKRPPREGKRPSSGAKHPPSDARRAPSEAMRAPFDAKRSPAGAKRPPPGAKRPASGAKRPPSGAKRPPATANRRPSGGAPSAVSRRRRPTGGR